MKTLHGLEEYDVICTVVGPPFVATVPSRRLPLLPQLTGSCIPWEFDNCALLSYFLITWKQHMNKIILMKIVKYYVLTKFVVNWHCFGNI